MAKRVVEELYPYETAKRIRLISNNCGYGPRPDEGEEIEQRLTFRPDGQVWLSGYGYTDLGGMEQLRSTQFRADTASSERIIRSICAHFAQEYIEEIVMDVGSWELEITSVNDECYLYRGPLCEVTDAFFQETSAWIREAIGFDLFAFDGNAAEDRVNRIEIEYQRITKIKPQMPISETAEYVVWDYRECFIIDRETEEITYKRIIGSGCSVATTYHVEEGIRDFLDDLDAVELFSTFPQEPKDVIVDPLEKRSYSITVDFAKAPQMKLTGDFDRDGLPNDWASFAESLREFICFYMGSEVLDPVVFKKPKRRSNALIFCSVEFEEGGRTYYYLADEDIYEVGDRVLVPVRNEGHKEIVEIVEKEYFDEGCAPFPLDRMKHIIRKVEDGEGDTVYCPVLERGIDDADCMEICDVADDLIDEKVMGTFDPPIQWTEELAEKCRNCEHRFC